MSGSAPASHAQPGSAEAAAELWHRLLRPDVELAPAFLADLNARMRAERMQTMKTGTLGEEREQQFKMFTCGTERSGSPTKFVHNLLHMV